MSVATVTSTMREAGWNVTFHVGHNPWKFAGLFQAPGSDLVTFCDVIDELRLCFEFNARDDDDSEKLWDELAFALISRPSAERQIPKLVEGNDRRLAVPSLPNRAPKQPDVIKYHLIRHKSCSLPENSPLKEHLEAKCAEHIPHPTRRRDPRYLDPKKTPSDPRYATMPLRRRARPRGSQSPPKRQASDFVSPVKDGPDDGLDAGSMIAPSSMQVDLEVAKKVMDEFRHACGVYASCCAVSGEGDSWVINPTIGPALQACHIVPQNHYHLYPITQDQEDDGDTGYSPRRLQEAWQRTWAPGNGILLMSHLHELFDQRLFSIHPETRRIRAFVPYNVLTKHNGEEARMLDHVDPNALRHHWDMCVMENMTAMMPLLELLTGGTNTPFSPSSELLMTPGSANGSQPESGRTGDPAKRSRPSPGPGHGKEASAQETLDGQEVVTLQHGSDETDAPIPKRRRLHDCEVREIHSPEEWIQDDMMDSYITPFNRKVFLADVNWELQRFKSRSSCS
ncbi:hypothetical protein Focb16_v004282 [Fusarium oxysporum f. sp. cubense]|uniref:HNH nuclease domain-containing protein n=1 Tax=Fusarium oxysporum f. sp. cubense TaxID=61366 RepID=A0A559KRM5_FUSOC|nr:hypothetical protein Focb16_v004282 [Fusarium oxysporum f. sp. cubense]